DIDLEGKAGNVRAPGADRGCRGGQRLLGRHRHLVARRRKGERPVCGPGRKRVGSRRGHTRARAPHLLPLRRLRHHPLSVLATEDRGSRQSNRAGVRAARRVRAPFVFHSWVWRIAASTSAQNSSSPASRSPAVACAPAARLSQRTPPPPKWPPRPATAREVRTGQGRGHTGETGRFPREAKQAAEGRRRSVGGGRIRTSEGRANGFTARPLWPLGNTPRDGALVASLLAEAVLGCGAVEDEVAERRDARHRRPEAALALLALEAEDRAPVHAGRLATREVAVAAPAHDDAHDRALDRPAGAVD